MLTSNFPIAQDESRLGEGNKDVEKFQRLNDKSIVLDKRVGIQGSLKEVEFNHENDQRSDTTLEIVGVVGNGMEIKHQRDDDLQVEEKLPSNFGTMVWSPQIGDPNTSSSII
jgi:hypothetical protein